jgi:hypothetical protein
MTYCLSAWGHFLNLELMGSIDALLKRLRRYGFTSFHYDDYGLSECVDMKTFLYIQN